MIAWRSAKVIAWRSAKVIAGRRHFSRDQGQERSKVIFFMSAEVPALGSAKIIGTGGPGMATVSDTAPRPNGQKEQEVSAKRIETHVLQEVVRLHRMGTGACEVARMLGMSPNTERTYRRALDDAGLLEGDASDIPNIEELRGAVDKHEPASVAPQQVSSVARWSPQIETLVKKGVKPKAIFDRLRLSEPDFSGSLGAVKRAVRAFNRERGVQASDVAIPVETAPGHVAQVDYGEVPKLYDPLEGCLRRAWVFVMTLAYSRHAFMRVVFNQRTETWLELHAAAFKFFHGVPAVVVPDNLKSAVIKSAFGVSDQVELNRSYRECARHFGFKVDPTPPYSPQKKGKVESQVKYVKNNFFAGRDGEEVTDVNEQLTRWTLDVAGQRVHGTTAKKPLEVFDNEERAALMPLPAKKFAPTIWKRATVHEDCHVAFEKRIYSAPWTLIGQKLWLRATPSTITLFSDDDKRVADHDRRGTDRRSTTESHLPEHRGDYRHRSREYWEQRAARIGPETEAFVRETFDSDNELLELRNVIASVRYLEKFPITRAEAACHRARRFASYRYVALKNILEKALDTKPLPDEVPTSTWTQPPLFARDKSTWVTGGGSHGNH